MKYDLPSFEDLMWPTLEAVRTAGGSATIQEIEDSLAQQLSLTEDQLAIEYESGNGLVFPDRASWARSHLKKIGGLTNSGRGIWALAEDERRLSSEEEVKAALRSFQKDYATKRAKENQPPRKTETIEGSEIADEEQAADWKDELLSVLKSMSPDGFERLCQRILREHGFTQVEVLGKSGDGGIDGSGILKQGLLSFHIRFQCKRYADAVSSPAIRDFRGAFIGRADKGLFMTTGRFTRDARAEAVRDGAPAIDLVDGQELCELIRDVDLGTTTEMVPQVTIHAEFFEKI